MNARFDPSLTTRTGFARVAPAIVEAARAISTATAHEAYGRRGELPAEIKPVDRGARICGPALTVHSPGGDNLWLHRAIALAQPGDILVAYVSGVFDYGYWGEIMSTAAGARQLGGVVIDGFVRDGVLLGQAGPPIFARGLNIRGTGKDFGARGWIGAPIRIGDTTIRAGDLVLGDDDGVACFPASDAKAVIEASVARDAREADVMRRLRAGETTMDIYGFDRG